MPTVTAVKLRFNPKSYWFDPVATTPQSGDHVLVETERGQEIGLVMDPGIDVTDEQVAALKSPLKPVLRVLVESDYDRVDELAARGRDAMRVFREHVARLGLEMRPVEVEFLFSGDKAVFYFTSDNRVDFRELVRDLASHFRMRIDMRQIGARDEARMIGGLAHCGEELCCARLGSEFDPVSIRMAKEQDLPLNPAKISGACGRLMCCLRYEFEAYKDFKRRAPKKGTLTETPLGQAKVVDFDTPREIIHMRLEDGKQLSVPLAELECEHDKSGCITCCRASREALSHCASTPIILALSALDREAEQRSELVDATIEPARVRAPRRSRRGGEAAVADKSGQEGAKQGKGQRSQSSGERKPRTRQSSPTRRDRNAPSGTGSRASGGAVVAGDQGTTGGKQQKQRQRRRPGQFSSGIRNPLQDDGASGSLGGATRGAASSSSGDARRPRQRQRPPQRSGEHAGTGGGAQGKGRGKGPGAGPGSGSGPGHGPGPGPGSLGSGQGAGGASDAAASRGGQDDNASHDGRRRRRHRGGERSADD
ncbi:MAG: hypothetical protein LBD25_08090 [Coriobacteriales bacterium]|jgi:cell fate regulator YaaT (PSP1 superfamily)|nr:hypothetical protein [Coriobacteriales bacterium]